MELLLMCLSFVRRKVSKEISWEDLDEVTQGISHNKLFKSGDLNGYVGMYMELWTED